DVAGELPGRVLGSEGLEVADPPAVIADPSAVRERPVEVAAGDPLAGVDGLQHRAARAAPAAEVVDRSGPRAGVKCQARRGEVGAGDVVPHLLALVAVDRVPGASHRRLHEVGEEAVKLGPGVDRTGDAPAAKAGGGHAEVAT